MKIPTVRAGLALFLLVALAAGLAQPAAADAPPTAFVVNVSVQGFDPPTCSISRRDTVAWKNVGTTPIRVIWPDPNGGVPLYDSGTLQPGETSHPYAGFDFPGHWPFRDAANSAHVGMVITPTFTNSVDPQCTPTGTFAAEPLTRGPVLPGLAADR